MTVSFSELDYEYEYALAEAATAARATEALTYDCTDNIDGDTIDIWSFTFEGSEYTCYEIAGSYNNGGVFITEGGYSAEYLIVTWPSDE